MEFPTAARLDQVNCAKLKYSGYEQTGGKLVSVENVRQKIVVEIVLVENVRWKILEEMPYI